YALSPFRAHCAPPGLHPFPTRRSSDLVRIDGPVGQGTTARVDDLGMADGATSAFALSARPVAEDSETVTFKLPYRWTDYTDKTRSEEHTSELQSRENLVCRLLLEKKNT